MSDRAATPLERLIAALARKAVAEHLTQTANEADKEKRARPQNVATRREAA